jgi:FSR family fosmidomycin resistance protein-like MFS transporter
MATSILETQKIHGRSSSLVFTSVAHFVGDGAVFSVPLIADVFAGQRAVSPLELTMMFVAFNASSAIFSPYVGRLADRSGRPGALIGVGLGLLSLGVLGFYVSAVSAPGIILFTLIILSALVAGFGSSFYHPLMASVLQTTFEEKARGQALGVNGAVGSVGRALYPTLFFGVAVFLTTYGSIALLALVGFAASAVIWVGLGEKRASRRDWARVKPKTTQAITTGIVALTFVAFVRSLATQGIQSWIPVYMSTQKGLGITAGLGLALTMMYAAAIIGQPIFGLLVDRFDKRLILGISSAGSAVSIFGYLFTAGIVETILLSLFGFFTFSAFPLLLSLASDYVPKGLSSFANALVWGLGTTGGSVLGPAITGAIILNDYANLGFGFEVLGLLALVSALGTALIPKPERSGRVGLFG